MLYFQIIHLFLVKIIDIAIFKFKNCQSLELLIPECVLFSVKGKNVLRPKLLLHCCQNTLYYL